MQLHIYEKPRRVKLIKTEIKLCFPGAGRMGGWRELWLKGYRVSVWGAKHFASSDDGLTTL